MTTYQYGRLALLAAVASIAAAGPLARQHAATAEIAGQQLSLRAKGTRSMLLGAVDLYSVGIYSGAPVGTVEDLRNRSVVKAVRVAVLYDGQMPGKVPSDWWRELAPALSPAQEQKLRNIFSRLSAGDDVWITYAPSEGTRMLHRGTGVISSDGDVLMNAILDLWLGPRPVSSDLHDTLMTELRRTRPPVPHSARDMLRF